MAYTIVKSDGTVLTTIADGTINTTSTSVGLPGRNFAGYGQTLDTNFVHQLENFADTTPPANPLTGQLWYNTNANTLYVCPTDGLSNANAWVSLAVSSANSTTTFGSVQVTGNLSANNVTAVNNVQGANGIFTNISVSSTANISSGTANIGTGNIGSLFTQSINAGSQSTAVTLTGVLTQNGAGTANSIGGTSMWITGGNLVITGGSNIGIRTDNYYYANGNAINFGGTYSNSNVQALLPVYNGAILATTITATALTTGANTTAGTMTGNFTLTAGSRLQSTYADLAERFEADAFYDAGTVVEMGGDKEITAVQYELSEDVFGVVSTTAGYLMNAMAGDDDTHPAIAVGGRVQVKVIGKVTKGQRLVSAGNGMARAAQKGEATAFNTIGRSLEDKLTDEIGAVEAFVKIN
jgi:hypothetical protein